MSTVKQLAHTSCTKIYTHKYKNSHKERTTIDTLHYVNEVSLKQFTGHCAKPLYSKVCKQKGTTVLFIHITKALAGKVIQHYNEKLLSKYKYKEISLEMPLILCSVIHRFETMHTFFTLDHRPCKTSHLDHRRLRHRSHGEKANEVYKPYSGNYITT